MTSHAIRGFAFFVIAGVGLLGVTLVSASAQASVTWDIVGTASGEPDLSGTLITPDIPVNCGFGPPAGCPISGTLTIPAGALGGPGAIIDLGVDPANVIISITAAPLAPGDDFLLFSITKDGYECASLSSLVLQCEYDSTNASYGLVLTEQVPKVVIGNGTIVITGQLQVAGQIIGPAAPILYSIGGTGPAGGKVFYITEGGLHGLEAAPVDQGSGNWGCNGAGIVGADGTAVGTGTQNTVDILIGCGEFDAARIADNYTLNGYSDWFLPSRDELNLMYVNLHDAGMGGFSTNCYWSSSEVSDFNAACQTFSDGNQGDLSKLTPLRVRAVRAF